MMFISTRFFALIGLSVLALSFAGCGSDDPAGVSAPDYSASAARSESTLAGFAAAGATAAGLTADVNLATDFETVAGAGDGADNYLQGAGAYSIINPLIDNVFLNNKTRNGAFLNIPVNEEVYVCPAGGSVSGTNDITPLGGTYIYTYDSKLNAAGTAVAKTTETATGLNIELELKDCGGVWGNVRRNYSWTIVINNETKTEQYAWDHFTDGGIFYDGGATNRYQITFSDHIRTYHPADTSAGVNNYTDYFYEYTRTVSDNVGSSASCSRTTYSDTATGVWDCR